MFDRNVAHVEYHSREWDRLVETGWVTAEVYTMDAGTRIARMIHAPERRRWL